MWIIKLKRRQQHRLQETSIKYRHQLNFSINTILMPSYDIINFHKFNRLLLMVTTALCTMTIVFAVDQHSSMDKQNSTIRKNNKLTSSPLMGKSNSMNNISNDGADVLVLIHHQESHRFNEKANRNNVVKDSKNISNNNHDDDDDDDAVSMLMMQDNFREFIELFGIKLNPLHVDFKFVDGFNVLQNYLHDNNTKYTTIIYVLRRQGAMDFGFCELSQQLFRSATKNVFFWPCPRMKFIGSLEQKPITAVTDTYRILFKTKVNVDDGICKNSDLFLKLVFKSMKPYTNILDSDKNEFVENKPEKYLPSYETISFAVKSVSRKFNWTEAIIFATGDEWGLPLAIAANLHVPYRIEIGVDHLNDVQIADNIGKVLIISTSINSPETIAILNRMENYNQTKTLLIDMTGAIFNKQNDFFNQQNYFDKQWKNPNYTKHHLFVLTILTEKLKQFLNNSLNADFLKVFNQSESDNVLIINQAKLPLINDSNNSPLPINNPTENLLSTERHKRNNDKNDFDDAIIQLIKNYTAVIQENYLKINFTSTISLAPEITTTSTNKIVYNENSSRKHSKNNNDSNSKMKMEKHLLNVLCMGKRCENSINSHISYCENILKLNQSVGNDAIKRICKQLAMEQSDKIMNDTSNNDRNGSEQFKNVKRSIDGMQHLNETQSDKYEQQAKHWRQRPIVSFGEFFNLFDFIASTMLNDATMEMDAMHHSNRTIKRNNTSLPIKFDFIVLDFHTIVSNRSIETIEWRPYLILQQNQINQRLFTTHHVGGTTTIDYSDWMINQTNIWWTCGIRCWSITTLAMIVFIISIIASIAVGISARNYLLKKRLSKGPNKIVLSMTDFVFPINTRRVDEGIEAMLCCWLTQLQEFGGPEVEKPDLLKGSIGSLKTQGLTTSTAAAAVAVASKTNSGAESLAKYNTLLDMRPRYNGDLVQLKEMPSNQSNELKSKAMDHLVMTHGLRHENINPLIGWLSDPNRNALVFEYCSRGSLQDVLIMDEIKLDWSFRLSLLTDLVRGMRYLHSSPLKIHGSLSSRNCVVDARWVLKITDYGLAAFADAQGLPPVTKTSKQLLWTAPEILRNTKGIGKYGTQPGDVYSFGIIMQEVVVRGEPYCMLSTSPDEIIAKIKKPPPLIRPSVSKGAAPPEAINIMRQCWAEMPEMRPDFNSVYERFKQLNHGRKVNFVDTMFQMLEKYSNNLEELIKERTEQLDIERKKTEQLLNRMLPSSVADKLKVGLGVDPEEFADVTIYFSDIVGFTTIAAHCSPVQVVDLLNDLYTCFDATINAYSVYKVETIGDAYMVVSGLPVRIPDHAEQIATMALDLLYQSGSFRLKHLPGVPLQLRIGLHTGPCCAGVVGLTMPRYCLFGDTVNTASRMESTGSSWRIHLSEVTRDRLEKAGGYYLEPRGPIEIKGKGLMNTYWLLGKKGFDKVLPTPPPIGESHGLEKCLLYRNSINLKAQTKTPSISANHSSSQSSSFAGETIDVKVEITPPIDHHNMSTDIIVTMPSPTTLPNSISFDSTTSTSMNLSINLLEYNNQPSPTNQQRKFSEISHDGFLNPTTFGRFTPSASSGTSSKLYKRIEELMDLSSPYNHYRCLSPSENNLTQAQDNNKYSYSITKLDKPGSSRLLRRQFSLDKEDSSYGGTSSSTKSERNRSNSSSNQHHQITLEIPHNSQELRASPTNFKVSRLPKQHSASLAIDLEKIEEIPLSPTSLLGNHHNNHHYNRCDINLPRIPGSESGSPSSRKDDDINGSIKSFIVEQQQQQQQQQNEFNANMETLVLR